MPELAAHRGQQATLVLALDSLGDDLEPERPRDLDDALGERQALLGDGDPFHEGPVHLQHVDRQIPQVTEGRVPGAEIVDGQPHADRFQLDQVGHHPLVPGQQDALGQFEHERPGFETRRIEGPAHAVDEAGRAELPGRHVHADVRSARGAAGRGSLVQGRGAGGSLVHGPAARGSLDQGPAARVARGRDARDVRDVRDARFLAPPRVVGGRLGQHPGAERHDLAGFFGQGDELAGLHHPPLRVRPSDQGLESGELPGGQRGDRLVGQRERGVGDRLLQRGLQLPPPDHPGPQYGLVAAPLPLTCRLGRVQGQVRVPQQLIGVGAVLGRGHSDGDRGEHGPGGERKWLAERPDNAAGGRLYRHGARYPADEQRELVATEPRDGVAVADQAGEPHGAGHQQLVADLLAHGVVHDLEVIQVDEQHADGLTLLPGRGELPGDPLLEEQPVGQPGQRVVEGLVLELLFELVLPGNVPQGEHQAGHGRVGAQIAGPDLDIDAHAVAAGDPPVQVTGTEARVGRDLHEGAEQVVALAVRDEVPQVRALHGDVAEDARGRRRRVTDLPVVTHDQDGIRNVPDQGAEVRLVAPADHVPRGT